jgi:hypothetical protein
MKGWQISLLSIATFLVGGIAGFSVGTVRGGVVEGLSAACLTAGQAVESKLITESQAQDLLRTVAEKAGIKVDAEKADADYRQKLDELVTDCLAAGRKPGNT